MDNFEATYSNDDGYAGPDRPFTVEIDAEDVLGESEEGLRSIFWDTLADDYRRNNIHLFSPDEEAFVEWAKAKQAEAERES